MDRFIFHGYIPKTRKGNFFSVSSKPNLNFNSKGPQKQALRFILNAGSDHGISTNDEVTVYGVQSEDGQRDPIGILVVDHVDTISSVLRAPELFTLPSESDTAPALLTKLAQPDIPPSNNRSPRTRVGGCRTSSSKGAKTHTTCVSK
jgi:hypothetical protein